MVWLWFSCAIAGEIVGLVRGADGGAIEDALVLAYDHRLKYELDYAAADGSFVLDDLKASSRRIRVISPDAVNAVEHYFDVGMPLCEADVIEVGSKETVDIGVVRLAEGGVVTGRVLGPDGLPLPGAEVSSRPSGVSATSLPRRARTGDDGRFTLRGVPIQADGSLWSFQVEHDTLPLQYLGGSFSLDLAETFGVGLGDVVDVDSWTLLPGGTLSGVVRTGAGEPVQGTAFATTTGRTRSAPVVDGAFAISGLAPGEATLWVESEGNAITWYPSAPGPGVTVTVTDAVVVDDLSIEVAPEGVVRGRFVGVDDFTGAVVYLVDAARTVSLVGTVSADGSFSVDNLPAGTWSVELEPADGTDLVDGPLLDSEGNLLRVEVARGGDHDLGVVEAPRGAVVEGKVVDRQTGDGVYGAWVYVVNANTQTSVLAQTGRAGHYRAEGLPAGVYRIRVEYQAYCDNDPAWVSRYYPDQRNELLTGSIPLAPGQVARWDPQMPPDMDQDDMDDAWEDRFDLDPTRDDGFEDLDGDGFSNLDEYLLGTNPAERPGVVGGCAGGGASWLLFCAPVLFHRRRHFPSRRLPV